MPTHFVYIGQDDDMMEFLRRVSSQNDSHIRRLSPRGDVIQGLLEDAPIAVLVDRYVHNIQFIIDGIRSDQRLASVPIVVCVDKPDSDFLSNAFRWGVDDYVVQNEDKSLALVLSVLQSRDSWDVVRAPAGKAIVAHDDRLARVKIARVLKRSGLDPIFLSSFEEVRSELKKQAARIVICSDSLSGVSIESCLENKNISEANLPWVVMASDLDFEKIRAKIPSTLSVRNCPLADDAEGVAYVVKEMLAPSNAGKRRSERLVYGTPITVICKHDSFIIGGYTLNINIGGLYIRTLAPLALNTQLRVVFTPPKGRGTVVADAQVVWCKKYEESQVSSPPGMGIQFLDMWEADTAAYETGYYSMLGKTPPKLEN